MDNNHIGSNKWFLFHFQLFRCEGCWRTSLEQIYQNNIMRELLGTVQKLQKKVDEKQQFDIGKKDHHEDPRILNVLNTLSKNTDDIKNQMSSIESNIYIPILI